MNENDGTIRAQREKVARYRDATERSIRVNMDHDDGTRDDGNRVTVHANDIVIDVIANDDGTVYIETYAYRSRDQQVVVGEAFIDRYTVKYPHLKLGLVPRAS